MRDFAKIFRDDEGRQLLVYVDPSNEDDKLDLLRIVAQRDCITMIVSIGFPTPEQAYAALDKMDQPAAEAFSRRTGDFDPEGETTCP